MPGMPLLEKHKRPWHSSFKEKDTKIKGCPCSCNIPEATYHYHLKAIEHRTNKDIALKNKISEHLSLFKETLWI